MSHPFVLHNTLGAMFVGLVVASTLFGVSIVQAWYYYGHHHQNDTWILKSLVGAVMTFDTIHQVLITHDVYTRAVTFWGDSAQLNKLVRTGLIEIFFTTATAFLVQSFLIFRMWRLSKGNIWSMGIAVLLILAQFAYSFSFYFLVDGMDTFTQMATLNVHYIAVNAIAAAGDVFIAGTLCVLLHRSRTGLQRSNTIINKLIIFSVNTGALTSLCAVASLLFVVVVPNTLIYLGFYFCIGRLYTNSMLASLNARKSILNSWDNTSTPDKLTVCPPEFPRQRTVTTGIEPDISIQINSTKELIPDLMKDQNHGVDQTEIGRSIVQGFEEKSIV